MKFSKCLHRISDAMNPAWAPYWPNYKLLKKLINEIPMCPAYAASIGKSEAVGRSQRYIRIEGRSLGHATSDPRNQSWHSTPPPSPTSASSSSSPSPFAKTKTAPSSLPQTLLRIPAEVFFFKVIHREFRKATHFFGQISKEIETREAQIKEDLDELLNLRHKNTSHQESGNDTTCDRISIINRWNALAKSIFQLHNTCMCLETYAIMCYCSFSKILKKHDKVSGFTTKEPFMVHVVQKTSNFFQYPQLLETISSMEDLYEHVSEEIIRTENQYRLYRSKIHHEEGQLFIDMIQRLNQQGSVIIGPSVGCGGRGCYDYDLPYDKSTQSQSNISLGEASPSAVSKDGNSGLLCNDNIQGQLSTLRYLVEASALSTTKGYQTKGQGSSPSSPEDEASAMIRSLADSINRFSAADQQTDGSPRISDNARTRTVTRTRRKGGVVASSIGRGRNIDSPPRHNHKRSRSTKDRTGDSMNNKIARLSKDAITDCVPAANE